MSSALRKLTLLFASLAISLGLAALLYEGVESARYDRWKAQFDNYGWFGRITKRSDNPILMWEYRPYGEIDEIKTNRFGFRDRDHESREKPPEHHRVAFVGDSVTLGMMVESDETFVRRFEAVARDEFSPRKLQTLNFGVDGYNAVQVLELIRTAVLPFSPDLVIYAMSLNDFDFDESSGMKIRYFQKPRSFVLERIQSILRRVRGTDFHLHHFGKNRDAVFAALISMHELAKQHGVGFYVALLPVFYPEAEDFDTYPAERIHKELARHFSEHQIEFVDLRAAFSKTRKAPSRFALDIWHPNPAGHLVIAKAIAADLREE